MKKVLFGILFFVAFASSAVTQKSIVGNWTLAPLRPNPNAIVSIEKDTLIITDDWKFTEVSTYNINFPSYGANKVDLKYKLRVNIAGDYRIESDALRKYQKVFESEILEGASNLEAAQTSLKEVEKLIRDDLRVAAPILNTSETEMELQGVNANPNLKYTKPRRLPISKLTKDSVPFFPPEGWRYPETAKELASFPVRLKNGGSNLLTYVKADFNGDGLIDAAAYLMNAEREQVALFINISQSDGSYLLKPYGNADRSTTIENGIMLASAGEHVDAVTKQKITIENPGIMEVIFDTTAYLIYWDSSSNEWAKITLGKRF